MTTTTFGNRKRWADDLKFEQVFSSGKTLFYSVFATLMVCLAETPSASFERLFLVAFCTVGILMAARWLAASLAYGEGGCSRQIRIMEASAAVFAVVPVTFLGASGLTLSAEAVAVMAGYIVFCLSVMKLERM